MIKIYGTPQSRATRITWVMEELQQEYEYHAIHFAKGDAQSPRFLAINPAGKVPAIEDEEGRILLESGAIVNYLAQKWAPGSLIPNSGTFERALYDQWSLFALTELEQPLWTIGKHKFALPKEHRKPDVIETAQWEFQKALTLLSNGLGEHHFILGSAGAEWDRFTTADLLLTHTLLWGKSFKQPIEQPNLQAYLLRCSSRDALKRAVNVEAEQAKR